MVIVHFTIRNVQSFVIINHFINHLTTLIFCFVKSIQFTYTVLRRFRMVGSTFVLLRRRLPRLHSSKIAFVRTNNSVYSRYVRQREGRSGIIRNIAMLIRTCESGVVLRILLLHKAVRISTFCGEQHHQEKIGV